MLPPPTQSDGLYPFNELPIIVEKLARTHKSRYYTSWESAGAYRRWLVRKDPSDFGPPNPPDTLPGVDSVRVVYVLGPKKNRR